MGDLVCQRTLGNPLARRAVSRSLKSVCLLLVFALFGCGAVRMNRSADDLQSSKLAYEQCVRAADSVDQCAKEKAIFDADLAEYDARFKAASRYGASNSTVIVHSAPQ